jgi:6-phosphogluconolactonase
VRHLGIRSASVAASCALLLLAVSPAARANSVYVGNYSDANISQYTEIAGGTLQPQSSPTAATGAFPQGIAVSPDGRSLYVASQGSVSEAGKLSQYSIGDDGALTPMASATVTTGAHPYGVAVSPDGKSVYVTAPPISGSPGGEIWQYDVGVGGALTAKATSHFATGGTNPTWIAVSPDSASVYVTNTSSSTISQYDASPTDGTLTAKSTPTVATTGGPGGIAVSPDGKSVYVTNQTGGSSGLISQYDVGPGGKLSAKSTATVASGQNPFGIAVTPDGANVYVADYADPSTAGAVSEYGVGAAGALVPKAPRDVAAGKGPEGIAISSDGTSVYVVNSGEGTVSQYDIKTGGVLAPKTTKTVDAGSAPFEIAVSPLPATPGGPPPPPPPSTATPDTHITSGPSGSTSSVPRFYFTSTVANSHFECRIDDEAFKPCTRPYYRYGLALGPHTFEVRAISSAGKVDPTPASRSFTLVIENRYGNCTIHILWHFPYSQQSCLALAKTCPARALCTLGGSVRVGADDVKQGWKGTVFLRFRRVGVGVIWCGSDNYRSGGVGFGYFELPRCPRGLHVSHFGVNDPANVHCTSNEGPSEPAERQRGADSARVLTCYAGMRIEPDPTLRVVPLAGTTAGVVAPDAGTFDLTGLSFCFLLNGNTCAARVQPPIKHIHRKVSHAGRVTLKLKLSKRAMKALRRRHAIKLVVRLTFTPKKGKRKTSKQTITLRLPCQPNAKGGCRVH